MPHLADLGSNHFVGLGSTSITTSVAVLAGDVVVVKAVTSDNTTSLTTPTDTLGNTYTLRTSSVSGSHCSGYLWTAVASTTGSPTVTHTRTGSGGTYSAVTEVWRNSDLAATPATVAGTGTAAPSTSLTTTGSNSAVSWACGDWAATSSAGHTYNTTSATPTEEYLDDQSASTIYTAYYAFQTAASAGGKTVGITAPATQTWTVIGVEVLDVPTGVFDDQEQYDRQPWH